jgi:hypothetical protein
MGLIKLNPSSNAHMLPILATFDLLIEGGLASELAESEEGVKLYGLCLSRISLTLTLFRLESLIEFASTNIDRMKTVQRIISCMRM